MFVILTFLQIVVFYFAVIAQECPSRWIERNGNCYYFSETAIQTRMSFYKARDFCLQRGGELTSTHDDDEINFIVNTVS